jgi:Ca2+-transporting ATPase
LTDIGEDPSRKKVTTIGGKVKEDEIDEKTGGVLSKKERKKKEKADKAAMSSALDPNNDQTDPTPFREKPSRLAMLVDPKSLEDLEKIGGTKGLLEGLGVDPKRGLIGEEGGAPRGSGDIVGSGAQYTAGIEKRREIYGRNELPQKPTKSLLKLMLLAFQDKILVS